MGSNSANWVIMGSNSANWGPNSSEISRTRMIAFMRSRDQLLLKSRGVALLIACCNCVCGGRDPISHC